MTAAGTIERGQSCCSSIFNLLTNRLFLRLAILLCNLIVAGCMFTYLPNDGRPTKDSAMISLGVAAAIGSLLALMLIIVYLCTGQRVAKIRLDCGSQTCNFIHWEVMSDFIVGFVMGLCSILLIRNVNCGSSQLCMRYNASLVFGVITMVMYAVLLLENIKIVLCGGDGHYSSSSSSSVNHNKQSSSSQTAGRQSPTKLSQKNDKEKKQKHWPPEEADEAGQSACDIEIELKRKSVWPPLADA